jgi:hypothetical protein
VRRIGRALSRGDAKGRLDRWKDREDLRDIRQISGSHVALRVGVRADRPGIELLLMGPRDRRVTRTWTDSSNG